MEDSIKNASSGAAIARFTNSMGRKPSAATQNLQRKRMELQKTTKDTIEDTEPQRATIVTGGVNKHHYLDSDDETISGPETKKPKIIKEIQGDAEEEKENGTPTDEEDDDEEENHDQEKEKEEEKEEEQNPNLTEGEEGQDSGEKEKMEEKKVQKGKKQIQEEEEDDDDDEDDDELLLQFEQTIPSIHHKGPNRKRNRSVRKELDKYKDNQFFITIGTALCVYVQKSKANEKELQANYQKVLDAFSDSNTTEYSLFDFFIYTGTVITCIVCYGNG